MMDKVKAKAPGAKADAAELVANAKQVIHWCKPEDRTWWNMASGALGASFFTGVYIGAPAWIASALTSVMYDPYWWGTTALWIPLLLSAMLPVFPSKYILQYVHPTNVARRGAAHCAGVGGSLACGGRYHQSWPFKHMPVYFDFTEVMEMTDKEVDTLMKTKRVVFAAQPHGVFTFGGACSGITWGRRFWSPFKCPTAVANVVMSTPLIKHAVGLFGSCDASSKTLKRTLKTKSCVLYPGGIAELFLTDHVEERIMAQKRKGFIKVALQSGVDVVPVYFFGNTQVLKLAKYGWLRSFSRATGVSLTWFWGYYGLPVPLSRKIVMAVGKPLNLPSLANPSQEEVDKYHKLYVDEVARIFDTYKVTHPDFVNKTLRFEQ